MGRPATAPNRRQVGLDDELWERVTNYRFDRFAWTATRGSARASRAGPGGCPAKAVFCGETGASAGPRRKKRAKSTLVAPMPRCVTR